jgi:hypothetical protein
MSVSFTPLIGLQKQGTKRTTLILTLGVRERPGSVPGRIGGGGREGLKFRRRVRMDATGGLPRLSCASPSGPHTSEMLLATV